MPVEVWFNLTPGLFVGALSSTRTCDLMEGTYLLELVNDAADRRGVGLTLACKM